MAQIALTSSRRDLLLAPATASSGIVHMSLHISVTSTVIVIQMRPVVPESGSQLLDGPVLHIHNPMREQALEDHSQRVGLLHYLPGELRFRFRLCFRTLQRRLAQKPHVPRKFELAFISSAIQLLVDVSQADDGPEQRRGGRLQEGTGGRRHSHPIEDSPTSPQLAAEGRQDAHFLAQDACPSSLWRRRLGYYCSTF